MTKTLLNIALLVLVSGCAVEAPQRASSAQSVEVPQTTEGAAGDSTSASGSEAPETQNAAPAGAADIGAAAKGCSSDGSDALIVGVWTSLYSNGGYAAVVLAPDCTACRAVEGGGVTSRSLSSKGRRWTSRYDGDSRHIRIEYTLGDGSTYDGDVVDLDERVLSFGGLSELAHGDGREFTCDGVETRSRPIP